MNHYIGVDVGTGSARAGVFDHAGKRLSTANKAIRVSHPKPGFVEQSTQDIWQAICDSVRQAISKAGITKDSISGIGFDATCSVTVMDRDYQPLPASPEGDSFWDVIVWMDHRAMAQADKINATGHQALNLSASADDLALQYLATIQAIAMGTRHIIETLNSNGYSINTIMACGGGTRNQVFLQAHANATGCTLQMAEEEESVLLGSAMLGAVAAGAYRDIPSAMADMSRIGRKVIPKTGKTAEYYAAKYKVFMELYEDQQKYKAIMNS